MIDCYDNYALGIVTGVMLTLLGIVMLMAWAKFCERDGSGKP